MKRPSYTHITVECYGCSGELLNDGPRIKKLLRSAAHTCNLHVVKEGMHRFRPQGVTGYVLLKESHISVHTWPEDMFALFDILSCVAIDLDALLICLKSSLSPQSIEVMMGTRRHASAGLSHQGLDGVNFNKVKL